MAAPSASGIIARTAGPTRVLICLAADEVALEAVAAVQRRVDSLQGRALRMWAPRRAAPPRRREKHRRRAIETLHAVTAAPRRLWPLPSRTTGVPSGATCLRHPLPRRLLTAPNRAPLTAPPPRMSARSSLTSCEPTTAPPAEPRRSARCSAACPGAPTIPSAPRSRYRLARRFTLPHAHPSRTDAPAGAAASTTARTTNAAVRLRYRHRPFASQSPHIYRFCVDVWCWRCRPGDDAYPHRAGVGGHRPSADATA